MSSVDLPEGAEKPLSQLKACLGQIETAWDGLKRIDVGNASNTLPPLENGKLQFTLAYALNSLYYSTYYVYVAQFM